MKTKWISTKETWHNFLIMLIVMLITCIGCSESTLVDPTFQFMNEEEYLNLRVLTEQYWVNPEGTTINALNGDVILEFPEGVVTEPTLFTLSSFPVHCLEREGYHLMDRGFSITSESEHTLLNASLKHYVKINMSFDSDLFSGLKSTNESAITIFYLNDYGCNNERIELMCKCIGEPSGTSVHGCLYCCGSYVVGES